MWEAARARLDALEGESGGSATEEDKPQSDASGGPKTGKSERVRGTKRSGARRAGKTADGLKSQKKTSAEKYEKTKEGMLDSWAVGGGLLCRRRERPK